MSSEREPRYFVSSTLVISPSLFSSSSSVRSRWWARYLVSSALLISPSLFSSSCSVRTWWWRYHFQSVYVTIVITVLSNLCIALLVPISLQTCSLQTSTSYPLHRHINDVDMIHKLWIMWWWWDSKRLNGGPNVKSRLICQIASTFLWLIPG